MEMKFEFRHDNLSIVELHKKGIRTTKWLEEVIMGDSFWDFDNYENENLVFATGFSIDVTGIVVVFKIDEDLKIITLDAKRSTIQEIRNDFCKYCKN